MVTKIAMATQWITKSINKWVDKKERYECAKVNWRKEENWQGSEGDLKAQSNQNTWYTFMKLLKNRFY